MQIQLMSFGALTDILGSDAMDWDLTVSSMTVGTLRTLLIERYPALGGKTFRIAVNERFEEDESEIFTGDSIALMPPFSGG